MGINQVWYKGTRIKYSSELRKHENENIKNIEKELNSWDETPYYSLSASSSFGISLSVMKNWSTNSESQLSTVSLLL
jgi:hypothetical protein